MSNEKIMIDEAETRAAAQVSEDTSEVSDEELEQFYEENKDAIDLIGGLDMFESLMALDDEQFTRCMLRILLSLQHNMAGLNRKSIAELNTYYMKLIALLADECAEWLKTLQKQQRH